MNDLCYLPAWELAERIRRHDLSPVELMRETLGRIDRLNPDLIAYTSLRAEGAMEDARAIEQKIADGEQGGPLAGLPLAVKDLEDVEGLVTSHGSVPFKDNIASRDSVQVSRLRAAGAIIVGKTNTPEFGCTAISKNRLFGVSRNPWDEARSPGGSSGGSAAAVAAGLAALATGSDGGGSIRIPASFCGAFGIKPTFGRVPRGPFDMIPWIDVTCYGPLTRCVRDAALYLDAVVGPHPSDPDSLPHPGYSYLESLEALPKDLRIGYSRDLGCAVVARHVEREIEAAVRVFGKDLGLAVRPIEVELPLLGLEWAQYTSFELYAKLYEQIRTHREDFGRGFVEAVEAAGLLPPERLGEIQRVRGRVNDIVASIFERIDLLLTPALPHEAVKAKGPFPQEIDGRQVSPLNINALLCPFNFTGHPAASIRAGLTDSGLPVGLQIVAPRHREDLILQAAYAYEQARPGNERWPSI